MDDIAKCIGEIANGKLCPLRDKCYRFTSQEKAKGYFWYFDPPYNETKQSCDQFMDKKDWK